MKDFKDYKKEYECGGDRSYFTVSIPAEDDIKQYQIKMLENNTIGLLLPLSVQRLNDDWKLFFDITSKIPLNRVLERKQIKQDTFIHMMLQIIKLPNEMNDYLLDLSSVVFDVSYIFCDPSQLDLYFLYIPAESCENEQDKLKAFLKKLLVEDINFSDDSSGVILKRLLEVLKTENFSIEQIHQCLRGSETEKESTSPVEGFRSPVEGFKSSEERFKSPVEGFKSQIDEPTSQIKTPVSQIEEIEKKPFSLLNSELKGQRNKLEIPGIKRNDFSSQQSNGAKGGMENKTGIRIENKIGRKIDSKTENNRIENKMGNHEQTQHERNQAYSGGSVVGDTKRNGLLPVKPSYLIIGVIDLIMLVVFILLITSKSIGVTNITGKIAGMVLVFASINYFLITKIVGKENEDKNNLQLVKQKNQSMQSKPAFKRFVNEEIEEDVILIQRQINSVKGDNQIPQLEQKIKQSTQNYQKDSIRKPASDKTVVLGKNSTPYLQNLTYPIDKIRLDKESILIGRLEDSVDHVIQNNAIGKIHAELVEKDGEYCIVDLNSVNGTYINGVKIPSNFATVINAGDKITFANESYTYID